MGDLAIHADGVFDGEHMTDGPTVMLVTDGRIAGVRRASLRVHLAAGVTTVRDLGDHRNAVLTWRTAAGPGLPAVVAPARRSPAPAGTAGRWAAKCTTRTNCAARPGSAPNSARTS
ncbi:hypothetical protein [Spongiactinospora sp. TRM90649]|uniref:hypothetical protein n=1 Tax=Spongiactinospora sp. TRM90649 TaxID=3031114 RepID=UPI0023F6E4C9|nr:hypothetical protein [Spongiactinospora sp. TRM90649]MDF5757602.1 hypothetical protein [Spongiactinospora sp. TRM90649]